MGTSRVCIWIAPQLFMLFFCTASRTTELCTLSLHDALPIFWTTQTAFNNALLAGHDYGTGDLGGHLSYVIYSATRSEEHTSELQSRRDLVCRLLLEKKNVDSSEASQAILGTIALRPWPARTR